MNGHRAKLLRDYAGAIWDAMSGEQQGLWKSPRRLYRRIKRDWMRRNHVG